MADEVLGRMAIELDLKDSSFTKGLTGAKQATRNAMTEMKANMAVIGQTGSKYEQLAMKGKGLTKALEAQKREMQLLDKEYKNSLTSNGEQTRASAKYAQQANNARAKVEALNRQIVENAKATARAKVETTGWTGRLNTISKGAISAGKTMSKFGDTFTKRVSIPIGAGFIYSAKQAIDFNSQIAALGPLLTNGGKLTSQYRKQLDQLAGSSKRWSKQYGVSTNDINSGMGELIRKGYTAKQTLGAMPAILDATKASGDSFNDVMHVSTSVLEQFGLKTKSTAGTLKNTTRVTDTLTTIANRTSAGFKDMGDAMIYIGPSAHAAGISLEETAAMVGILSNKGIEGSQAGTALRGALTRLIKPSKQNVAGFKELGINVEDFKKGTLTLPDMLDKIKNNTKGWTKEQRASAVALAFGTEAQSGMNALISAGGDELRKYTKYAKDSAGSTKSIADSMNNTQAAKIKRFQQTLHVLSIDIGEKLLPAFEPVLSEADKWINKFDNMSDHTQSLIVKADLLAVALGPTASILGRIITTTGKFGAGIVKVKGYFAAVRAGKDAMDMLGMGTQNASTGLSTLGGSFSRLGPSMSGMGNNTKNLVGSTTMLGSSFKLLNPYVLGATAAIAAGVTVWELWGKKAYQSSQESGRWGSSVGKTADTALTKFKGTSTGIVDALTDMETAGHTSTKSLSKSFDSEFGQIEKSAKEHLDNVNESIKGLDPSVQNAVGKSAQKTKKTLDATIADAKSHYKIAETILKGHNGKVSDLNDDQRIMLRNQQDAMAEDEIKVLGITGKKKKTIMAALNNDISGMTRAQRTNAMRELQDYSRKSQSSYAKQSKALKKALDDGKITQSEYSAGMKQLGNNVQAATSKAAAAYIQLAKKNGQSTATIKNDMLQMGMSYDNGMKYIKKHSKVVENSNSVIVDSTGKMTKKVRSAADSWNKLVFDPKTGKVKTNAQEEVNKAVKSGKKWDQIKLLVKEGKLSTNAKEMVATAAIAEGKWDSMTWKEQKALIKTEGSQDLVKMMENSGEWNDLTIEQKTAIVNAKGKTELADMLIKTGVWNDLSVEEKDLVLNDNGTKTLYDMLNKLGQWNSLTVAEKTAVVSGDGRGIGDLLVKLNLWNTYTLKEQIAMVATKGGGDMANELNKIGQWNNLTPKEQVAIMTAKGKPEMVDALVTAGVWNSLTLKQKQAQVKTEGTVSLIDQLNKMGQWNNLPSEAKDAIVNAKGSAELGEVLTKYDLWAGLPAEVVKQIIAEDKASGNTQAATDAVNNWNKANPGKKDLEAQNNASPKLGQATGDVNMFRMAPIGKPKNAQANNNASKPMGLATGAVNTFRNTSPGGLKTAKGKDSASGSMNSAKGSTDRFRNTSTGSTKLARGSDLASRPMGSAKGSTDRWRGTSAGGTKNARAHDAASGPAGRAVSAVNSFRRLKDHTVNLITNTIHNIFTKHSKKANGTNFHMGGPALVNDQPGPVFREMVRLRTGETFIPQGRNVELDLPVGAQVLRADLTAKKFRGLPQYANGIGDNTRLLNQAVDVTNQLKADGGTQIINAGDNTAVVDALKEQTGLYRDQISILSNLLDVATNADSNGSTRETIRNISQQLNSFNNNHSRGRLT